MWQARRFLLVGLFVTVLPGSLLQLVFATVASFTFLVVQILTAPLLRTSDNVLAGGSPRAAARSGASSLLSLPQTWPKLAQRTPLEAHLGSRYPGSP